MEFHALLFLFSRVGSPLISFPIVYGGEHQEFDTVTMKVLVFQYLITAAENQGSAVKVMNQWIDPRSLQFGAILGAHFAKSTMELLDAFFSAGRDSVIARALKWGGRPNDFGDTGFTFYLFPRLPVALIHWNRTKSFLLKQNFCTMFPPVTICRHTD